MTWNMIQLSLLLYTATFIPYRTAFIFKDESSTMAAVEIFVDVLYVVDLFLNFFMAYEDIDKKIEVRLK